MDYFVNVVMNYIISFIFGAIIGFILNIILGVITGFIVNRIEDFYKKKRIGEKPFVKTEFSKNLISFSGQINNTITAQLAISDLSKNVNGNIVN